MDMDEMERLYARVQARQFKLKAQSPLSWKITSLSLKRAADHLYDLYHDAVLRQIARLREELETESLPRGPRQLEGEELEDALDSGMVSIYYLLMGYAIENLLKAILTIERPHYFKPDRKLTDIKTHKLVDLCQQCKIDLDRQEVKLLSKLATSIVWRGKYPIPLEKEKLTLTGGDAFRGREQQDETNTIYAKIWDELERKEALRAQKVSREES